MTEFSFEPARVTQESVTLDEALRLTLENDPNVKIQEQSVVLQQGLLEQSQGQFDVLLSAGLNLTYTQSESDQKGIEGEQKKRKALADAIEHMLGKKLIDKSPMQQLIASVSVGIFKGQAVLDLDYDEDSNAETDMNIVMNESGALIEIQGTAEGALFTRGQLDQLLDLAEKGVKELSEIQKAALFCFPANFSLK